MDGRNRVLFLPKCGVGAPRPLFTITLPPEHVSDSERDRETGRAQHFIAENHIDRKSINKSALLAQETPRDDVFLFTTLLLGDVTRTLSC